MSQYINYDELADIQKLTEHLEASQPSNLSYEATVIDANESVIGVIKTSEYGSYAFFPRVA